MLNHTERAKIWQRNYFNGDNLRSSITYIPGLLQLVKAKTVFEVGCGQSHIWDISGIDYIGGDICGDLIEDNKRNHPEVAFIRFDVLRHELPNADVVIVKDLFECLPNDEVRRILQKIYASKCKWMIAGTDPRVKDHPDTTEGVYRPINLQDFGCKLVVLANNNIGLFELSRKWEKDGGEEATE